MAVVNGKKGKVKITEVGDVEVIDNNANSTYLVGNKPGSNNTFVFENDSGKDVIIGSDSDDSLVFAEGLDELTFTKSGKNADLVIKKNDDKDSVTLKDYFNSDDRIEAFTANEIDASIYNQTIQVSGSGKIESAKGFKNDITGSKKADTFYIELGRSNEIKNTITINKGDGNDTLIVSESENIDYDDKRYGIPEILFDEDAEFSYSKDFMDLIITATHADGKQETVRVAGYFDFDGELSDIYENPSEWNLKDVLTLTTKGEEGETIVVNEALKGDIAMQVNSIKASQLLNYLLKEEGVELPKGLKIPAAIKNIKAYLGSEYNDVFEGSNGKDVMISFGGNANTFTTGKKGQSVIVSMDDGGEYVHSNDTYNVSSFTAGTVIVDGGVSLNEGGIDKVKINGVDTNDIHMAVAGGDMLDGTSIAFLTDTKGVSNLAGLDIPKIYNKVMEVMSVVDPDEGEEPTEKQMVKTINSALKMIPGIIGKVRGVGLVTPESHDWYGDEEVDVTSNLLEHVTVVDKNGNEQTISRDDMRVYQTIMVNKVMDYVSDVINLLIEKEYLPADATVDDNIGDVLEYIITQPATKADKKVYNKIKSGFFDLFKNMYIGTSGDNEYTIEKFDNGVDIVSGTGNDKFVFKGDIGNKTGITYNVVSKFGENDVDSIELKNYSFAGNTLFSSETFVNPDDNVYFSGLELDTFNYNRGTLAAINYGINDIYNSDDSNTGYDITTNKFEGLTITDADTTYNVTAEYNAGSLDYDWSTEDEAGANHYAILNANNSSVISNDANNIISAHSFASNAEDGATFNYSYNGGHDKVSSSNNFSNDTYTVETFDNDTYLTISDAGMSDDDKLIVGNGDSGTKLFFNVDRAGKADGFFSLISTENMNKENFSVFNIGEDSMINVKSGINFTMNLGYWDDNDSTVDSGIEHLRFGDSEVQIDAAVAALTQEVANWLTDENSKGYADVADVLSRGSKSEIAQMLAVYDRFDATQYCEIV